MSDQAARIPSESETQEWYSLSPAERFVESQKLWEAFLLYGGSCEPEPDTQSPFYPLQLEDQGVADGRTGVHPVRGGRVQQRH